MAFDFTAEPFAAVHRLLEVAYTAPNSAVGDGVARLVERLGKRKSLEFGKRQDQVLTKLIKELPKDEREWGEEVLATRKKAWGGRL